MVLIGRADAAARLAALVKDGDGPITVWGPPGVGTSALVRHVLPEWRLIDGSSALPADPFVVWDHVSQERAREAVASRRHVVVTSGGPLGIAHERCVEVRPLALGDARTFLEVGLRRLGRRATAEELHAMAVAADGLPGVLQATVAGFDVLGAGGLSVREDGWQAKAPNPPHLSGFTSRLDESWALLDDETRSALRDLAMVLGPIRLDLAVSLFGGDAARLLRRLRDGGWLHVVRPGTLRILGPLRNYLLRTHGPTDGGADRLVAWAFGRAKAVPKPLNSRCRVLMGEYAADLREAVRRCPYGPGAPEALGCLSLLAPSLDALPWVEEGLRRQPRQPDLEEARERLLIAHRKEDEIRQLWREDVPQTDAQRARRAFRFAGLAHSMRKLDEAQEHYLRALEFARAWGNPRFVASVEGNLGMLLQNRGRVDEAMEHYARALAAWRNHGGHRQRGLLRSNMALILITRGRLREARWQLSRAREIIDTHGVPTDKAVIRINLGMLAFVERIHAEADHHLRDALDLIEGVSYPGMELSILALMAANTALLGDASLAKRLLRRAAAAAVDGPPLSEAFVGLHHGFIDLVEGRRAEAGARLSAARRADDGPALVDVSHDARLVAGALEAELLTAAGPALYVAEDASWFRLSDERPVSFERSATLRCLLRTLAMAPIHGVQVEVDDEVLFAAAWPDDPASEEVLRKRLRVAVSKLRAAGLGGVLLRGTTGYYLEPELPVLWVASAAFAG